MYDFWEYLPSLQLCYMAAQGPTRSQWKHIINILDNTSYILYHKQLDLKTYRRGRVGSGGSVCPAVTVSGIKAEARVLSFPSGLVSWKIVENWGMLGIITDHWALSHLPVCRSTGSRSRCPPSACRCAACTAGNDRSHRAHKPCVCILETEEMKMEQNKTYLTLYSENNLLSLLMM